jgi:uncharacterized membrane protein
MSVFSHARHCADRGRVCAAAATICLLILSPNIQAQVLYTVEELGTLGGPVNEAYDIAPDNRAVGRVLDPTLAARAVLWAGAIENLNGTSTQAGEARGISSNGLIAGSLGSFATLWTNGTPTPLSPIAGHIASRGWDVNASGLVIGWSVNSVGDPTAAQWLNGVLTPLDVNHSWAFAVNDAGQIIGRRDLSTGREARLWHRGVGVTLPDLDANSSSATGISPRGIITGGACMPVSPTTCAPHNVVWMGPDHIMTLLDDFPALDQAPWSANDRGVIVGYAAFDFSGESQVAIMWQRFDLPPVNVNTLIDPAEGWVIQSAQAINHSGTIAGYGVRQGFAGRRAVLLHPINPSDITFDAQVDTDDLIALILAWGACPQAAPCPADIVGNGAVDSDDLVQLILDWG